MLDKITKFLTILNTAASDTFNLSTEVNGADNTFTVSTGTK